MEKVITDLRFQINNSQRTIQTLEHKIKEKDATLADYEAYMRVKRKQNME
jgi:prefoldin subunit 5